MRGYGGPYGCSGEGGNHAYVQYPELQDYPHSCLKQITVTPQN